MESQLRRTKIIATLGPATDAPGMLKRILEEGVDVVRLNMSHGNAEDQRSIRPQDRGFLGAGGLAGGKCGLIGGESGRNKQRSSYDATNDRLRLHGSPMLL